MLFKLTLERDFQTFTETVNGVIVVVNVATQPEHFFSLHGSWLLWRLHTTKLSFQLYFEKVAN